MQCMAEKNISVDDQSTDLANSDTIRFKILELENTLSKIDGAVFGDSDLMPLKHSFSDGMYVREIFIPKGCVLTGKIHKHSHPNFLMKGEVIVVTESKGREHLKAPMSIISEPGTKRAVVALEDTVWVTVHLNIDNGRDLVKIEDYVIAKSYDDPAIVKIDLERKNCLILALKEKGLDYGCLMGLQSNKSLLPFKESLGQLKAHNVPLDGLFATQGEGGEWHVTTSSGTPLSEIEPNEKDMVGSWGGVAVAGGAVASALISNMGKKKQEQVPLETPEQRAARLKLMDFSNTGKLGDFTAGAEVPLGYGDYGMTKIEGQGQTALQNLLKSGLPSQYSVGDNALMDYLKTNPTDVSAQYDPFKAQVNRQIKESNRALKRNAGVAGNLYSTDTIRGLGDIQARGNETLTSQLANLTNESLNRRLQAIPLAYQSGEAQQAAILNQIGASQQYGGLARQLNDASIKARDAELLRRRQELQLPIQAAQTVSGQTANYGVPSITTNPYGALLGLIGQIGGSYLANKNSNQNAMRYYPSGSGSEAVWGNA